MQHIYAAIFFLYLMCLNPCHSLVQVTIGITVVHPTLPSLKSNATDVWNLMYIGLYAQTDVKVQAMKFAVQYINNMTFILPTTRIELYGFNSKADRASTTSAVFAGYAGYNIWGFIGAETYTDSVALQYIAGAYWIPQINPTVVEQSLSDPTDYRSLLSIIPPSSDQQMVILALFKKFNIKTALIVTTNNEYGAEMSDMMYNVEAIKLNITFFQVILDTNASDFDQKLNIVKEKISFFRYVIMHCSSTTGLPFLQAMYNSGLVGPEYLLIEKPANAIYLPYFNGAIGITARYNSDSEFSQNIRTAWSQVSPRDFPAVNNGDLGSAWFVFDAVYAYALALDRLQKQGNIEATISGEGYFDELMKSDFIGATGNITVNQTANRRNGLWDVVNFVPENVTETENGTVAVYYRAIGNGQSTDLTVDYGGFKFYNGNTTVPPPYLAPPEPLKIRSYNKALSAALGAIVGLATILAVFAMIMLFMFWKSFATHGSIYSAVIIAGAFIISVAALVVLPEPTDALCIAFPWFLGVGFTCMYGCLFIKTLVIYRVWLDAEQFKKTALKPSTIFQGIGVAVALEMVYLIVWTLVDPPQAKLHSIYAINSYFRYALKQLEMVDGYYMLQCRTKHEALWAVFIGIKGLWLLFGASLSIITRRIMKEFNFSKSIGYATYNICVLLIVGIPLAVALEDIPGGQLIIEVAVIVISFSFTLVSLFFPTWYKIIVPYEDPHANVTISVNTTSGGGRSVSHSRQSSRSSHSRHSTHSANSGNKEEELHTVSTSNIGTSTPVPSSPSLASDTNVI